MKRRVSIFFINNFLSDLTPRVNISLAGEIFPSQHGYSLPEFMILCQNSAWFHALAKEEYEAATHSDF